MRVSGSDRPLLPLITVLVAHLAVGCCLAAPGPGDDKGGGPGAKPGAGKEATAARPAAKAPPVRRTWPTGVPSEADLVEAIGGKGSGWLPAAFSDLRKGMSTAEVDRLYPGAAAVDKLGFSAVPATMVPGGKEVRFMFLGRHGLVSFEIKWDQKLTKAPGFWERLLAVCSAKYDHVKPRDVDKEFRIVTWGYDRTAQVSTMPEPGGGETCRLNVQL